MCRQVRKWAGKPHTLQTGWRRVYKKLVRLVVVWFGDSDKKTGDRTKSVRADDVQVLSDKDGYS